MSRFSNILFVADLAIDSTAAFNQAVTLAKNNQAKLTVVGVVDGLPESSFFDSLVSQYDKELRELVKNIDNDILEVETEVLVGKDFIEIIYEVLKNERDLVIKAVEHDESIEQRLFGSTDMKLLRKCPCPVWLIKSSQKKSFRKILVAIDYEPNNPENESLNRELLGMGISQALTDLSELHIVHTWQLENESFMRSPWSDKSSEEIDIMSNDQEHTHRDWLNNCIANYCGDLDSKSRDYIQPKFHLIKGDPKTSVSECAKNIGAELLVIGTVGRTGIPGFIIGNTAESILTQIKCSVLAVKPSGFISPVTL